MVLQINEPTKYLSMYIKVKIGFRILVVCTLLGFVILFSMLGK